METAKNKEKIVIIGFGWIGQANAVSLLRMGYSVSFYDVTIPKFHYSDKYFSFYEKLVSLQHPLENDSPDTWYIICVGDRVDLEGNQDISLICRALDGLAGAQGKIIVRSTILPSLLTTLRFDFYVPEFLHEIRAVEECINPYYFVLGMRDKSAALPSFLTAWQERAYKVFTGTPEEASYIKYLSNIWNAVRIAFVNEFGDSILLPTSSAERERIERVMDFVLERKNYLRYGRSFGGHCLPKDLRAYKGLKKRSFKVPLLEGIYAANAVHEEVEQKYQTLPQWFSTWEYSGQKNFKGVLRKWWYDLNQWRVVRKFRHIAKPVICHLESFLPTTTLFKVKERWNDFARLNAFYYINPDSDSGKKIDEFEIMRSGQEDFEKYVLNDQILKDLLTQSQERDVLEIGAGIGRITEHLSKQFKTVCALDISDQMLAIARKRLLGKTNVIWKENWGNDIPMSDQSFDFVFSYKVFKYLSSPILLADYLREIYRCLRPGGLAKINLRSGVQPHRWQWFFGISLARENVEQLAKEAGLQILKTEAENSKSLWLWLKKI